MMLQRLKLEDAQSLDASPASVPPNVLRGPFICAVTDCHALFSNWPSGRVGYVIAWSGLMPMRPNSITVVAGLAERESSEMNI
jgi:hypothetical protein